MERLEEYRAYNSSFTTRLTQFLSVLFSAQVITTNLLPHSLALESYLFLIGGSGWQ